MNIHRNGVIAVVLSLSIVMLGCSASNAVKGGAIGVGGGAVIGGLIGNAAGNTALGLSSGRQWVEPPALSSATIWTSGQRR